MKAPELLHLAHTSDGQAHNLRIGRDAEEFPGTAKSALVDEEGLPFQRRPLSHGVGLPRLG